MKNFSQLTDKDVKRNLVNIPQVVFEVTDACNLKCKYCGYGELYSGYDERDNQYLAADQAKLLIDYLAKLWESNPTSSYQQQTFFSFYGGEPLLGMDFIKETISYIEGLELNRGIRYSMTTNAMLLDRHMEYLKNKNFNLLISLDGDEYGQSYRVNHNGANSFEQVIKNIELLRERYPVFFESNVHFNSVLHNRNSVEKTHNFIMSNYGKKPSISELNNSGIRPDKVTEFLDTYKNKTESLYESENYEKLSEEMFVDEPTTNDLLIYLHQYSGNVFKNYNELFLDMSSKPGIATGTCPPFSKKLFLTVNGKIIQCERIDHNFTAGQITNGKIELDFIKIAAEYNRYINKIISQCRSCYRVRSCVQCIYYIESLDGQNPDCKGYMDKEAFSRYSAYCTDHLARNPQLYEKLMRDIIIE